MSWKTRRRTKSGKKVIAQVNQYPQWHDQSIQIRDGLAKSIGSLETKLDEIQDDNNRRYATTCRYRIIRFNDEIFKNGERHTKEHFDQILIDIDEYEDYCNRVPEYKNNKAVLAIANIKQTYQKCLLDGDIFCKRRVIKNAGNNYAVYDGIFDFGWCIGVFNVPDRAGHQGAAGNQKHPDQRGGAGRVGGHLHCGHVAAVYLL